MNPWMKSSSRKTQHSYLENCIASENPFGFDHALTTTDHWLNGHHWTGIRAAATRDGWSHSPTYDSCTGYSTETVGWPGMLTWPVESRVVAGPGWGKWRRKFLASKLNLVGWFSFSGKSGIYGASESSHDPAWLISSCANRSGCTADFSQRFLVHIRSACVQGNLVQMFWEDYIMYHHVAQK